MSLSKKPVLNGWLTNTDEAVESGGFCSHPGTRSESEWLRPLNISGRYLVCM